jgi:hypothetical protein
MLFYQVCRNICVDTGYRVAVIWDDVWVDTGMLEQWEEGINFVTRIRNVELGVAPSTFGIRLRNCRL